MSPVDTPGTHRRPCLSRRRLRPVGVVCALIGLLAAGSPVHGAKPDAGSPSSIRAEWGGYVRSIGTLSRVDEGSVYRLVGDDPYADGQLELRLKNRLTLGPRWTLETHYELVSLGGDTRRNAYVLANRLPPSLSRYADPLAPEDDSRRFFDLTRVLSDRERVLTYHRLDRLNLTWLPDWGTVRLGRQALTWGDGLIFNPMDLFNPFSPTAVQRDYKTGDDMALVQTPVGQSELQWLYLPRRDPATGDLSDEQSSYAVKWHTSAGTLDMDVLASRHYDDAVGGLGASGYLGEAVWRIDSVFTALSDRNGPDGFFQVVANVDYAWMWGGRNVYGLVEFYYNGLGLTGDYALAFTDEVLMERLARGEMFTIGRYYLAGQLQVEMHPLVRLNTTAILNLADPSSVLQPQVVWDVFSDVQVILGVQWHWGGSDSEFGGYDVTAGDTGVTIAPADQLYLWLTWYF